MQLPIITSSPFSSQFLPSCPHHIKPCSSLSLPLLHSPLSSSHYVHTTSNHAAPYHYLFSILFSVPPIMSTPQQTMQLPITTSSPFSSQFQSPLYPVASTDRHAKSVFLQITCYLVSAVRIRMMDCQIVI
jgi:hypothetical protein